MSSSDTFLDRLIERLDRLDPTSVQNYVLKLVREKGFLESVFNTIHEGIIVIERDMRIRYLNARAQELLGVPENAEGEDLRRFLPDIDWMGLMDANTEEWRRVSFQEIEVFYPRNRILTFHVVPHNTPEGEEQIPLVTLIFQDVTEARRDTELAIESERVEAVTKLAAGVAHELGNPLNSLTIQLQLLERGLSEPWDNEDAADAKETVRIALDEVRRLDSIVNNFLRAIRPTPPDLRPLRIQTVLAEALRFLRAEIEDRKIRVEASLPDKLPVIQGDPGQLKQAFYNIIRNSLQALSEDGKITIDCETTDDFLDIRFADNGRGISADNMRRIMEPYYTTRPDGSGLGLMVVERILRSHGAEFGIESAEDEGTTFRIRFPLHERHTRLLEAGTRDDQKESESYA
ncbi:MAG: PAS domain-containing protein [Candidatus Pacebacteria bacterium]|nr:PAS domain-containing protein [Candidatus Paceibacterota bacterium]